MNWRRSRKWKKGLAPTNEVIFDLPVKGDDLVRACVGIDVGIIPYPHELSPGIPHPDRACGITRGGKASCLGLCGAPMKLRWGKPGKCFKDVVDYVDGNRCLRRIAVRNSRIKSAMRPPAK